MKRGTWEGLTVFDIGEVAGADCRRRNVRSCDSVQYEHNFACNAYPSVACSNCLFGYPANLDAFRRWEAAGCPVEEGVS